MYWPLKTFIDIGFVVHVYRACIHMWNRSNCKYNKHCYQNKSIRSCSLGLALTIKLITCFRSRLGQTYLDFRKIIEISRCFCDLAKSLYIFARKKDERVPFACREVDFVVFSKYILLLFQFSSYHLIREPTFLNSTLIILFLKILSTYTHTHIFIYIYISFKNSAFISLLFISLLICSLQNDKSLISISRKYSFRK